MIASSKNMARRQRPIILKLWALAVIIHTGGLPSSTAAQTPQSNENLVTDLQVGESSLAPGDELEIYIWLEPDLSGVFLIDNEGVVTLPMLGRVHATQSSISNLRTLLIDRYSEELRNPSIEITPQRRVYILGEVNEPGMYSLDPTASLASAVALAGGASPDGDLKKLTLVRGSEPILSGIDPMSDLLSTGTRSGDQIFVERRGWLERNQQWIGSSVIGVVGIVVAILTR